MKPPTEITMVLLIQFKGYTDEHIQYLELADGSHDVATWAKAFPAFLKWGWGVQDSSL
ncbi:MAG: hypothetical protein FD136_1617 [Chitinophagaceae bacterium]|nr:MAG: hypothetical protein FD136_1617 [Chitinophagaceae bacterium]